MRNLLAGFCVLALAALCACGGSSDGGVLSGPSEPLDEADVNETVAELLIPALESLDWSDLLGSSARAAAVARSGGDRDPCEPLTDFCESGSAIACLTGPNTVVITFTECLDEGDVWNGTVSGTMTSPTSGTFTFNLTMGPFRATGTISFYQSGNCLNETITQYGFSMGDLSSYIDGTMEYCLGEPWPSGQVMISMTVEGTGSYGFDIQCDGTSTAGLVIRDLLAGGAIMASCTVDMGAETATCDFA